MIKNLLNKLIFIPLGGSGEIGLNTNLYHINGKWIIVDLGLGFVSGIPGTEIIVPNIEFIIREIRKDILGIVLTHAHDDHIGGIQYLWNKIKCPIYSTKFTIEMVKSKWKINNIVKKIKFYTIKSNQYFNIGDFKITLVPISHSIPENNSLLIETKMGNIFHTGDWKIDKEPILGNIFNERILSIVYKKKISALISDSTNIFKKHQSISEGILNINLEKIFLKYKKIYDSSNNIFIKYR